jgi:hypothetical protein
MFMSRYLRELGAFLRRVTHRVSPAVWLPSILLWGSGSVLIWLGLVGDRRGWWTDRPFLTNLVSGLTGACFGIPVALLILTELSNRQRQRVEGVNAVARYDQAVDDVGQVVRVIERSFCEEPPRAEMLERWAAKCSDELAGAWRDLVETHLARLREWSPTNVPKRVQVDRAEIEIKQLQTILKSTTAAEFKTHQIEIYRSTQMLPWALRELYVHSPHERRRRGRAGTASPPSSPNR